jgi:hypothetical protein
MTVGMKKFLIVATILRKHRVESGCSDGRCSTIYRMMLDFVVVVVVFECVCAD